MKDLMSRLKRERGAAVTEFALMSIVLVMAVFWSLFFYDLIYVQLKTQEAAIFAAWEMTSYPLSDFKVNNRKADVQKKFGDAKTAVKQKTEDMYEDLDSSGDITNRKLLTLDYSITEVKITNANFSLLQGESMQKALNDAGGGAAANVIDLIFGGLNNIFDIITNWFQFNGEGLITVEVTSEVTNKMIPERVHNMEIFPSEIKKLTIKERVQLLIDPWNLGDGSDVMHNDKNKPYYKQLERVTFLGAISKLNSLIPGLGAIKNVMEGVLNFLNLPNPFQTLMVSKNYKNNDRESGMVELPTDGGIKRFHTSPMRYTQSYEKSKFYNVFSKRGQFFMGCPTAQQKECWKEEEANPNPNP